MMQYDAIPDEGEDGDVVCAPDEFEDPPAVKAPLADQVVVEAHADALAMLWHEGRDYDDIPWPEEMQQMEGLLPWAI